MVVDYLPGAGKTYCRIPTNWQACCIIFYITTTFWLANNVVIASGTVLAAKRSGAADSGLAANVKTSAQSAHSLSPLHMDVHAGNLVHSASGLKLINWDLQEMIIALELAAVWVENTEQHRQLVNDYATRAKFIRRNYGVRSGDRFLAADAQSRVTDTAGDKPAINNLSGWPMTPGGGLFNQ